MKTFVAGLLGAAVLSSAALVNAADYVENYQEVVKQADWKAMETITIELDEYHYEGKLEFKSGKAYKIELKNVGEKKHYFTAPEFFKSIATRKAEVNGQAEIKADYFTAIEVLPGGQLDLYFVAHDKGEFPVYCTIDDHREEGMEDVITVK